VERDGGGKEREAKARTEKQRCGWREQGKESE